MRIWCSRSQHIFIWINLAKPKQGWLRKNLKLQLFHNVGSTYSCGYYNHVQCTFYYGKQLPFFLPKKEISLSRGKQVNFQNKNSNVKNQASVADREVKREREESACHYENPTRCPSSSEPGEQYRDLKQNKYKKTISFCKQDVHVCDVSCKIW